MVAMVDDRLRSLLCGLVAVVWAASMAASFLSADYHPDPAINGVFSAVIGFMLTRGKDDEDEGGDGQ